eukprot:scaffold147417_cov23-Prasinocladus_malaysianus.AAC.1
MEVAKRFHTTRLEASPDEMPTRYGVPAEKARLVKACRAVPEQTKTQVEQTELSGKDIYITVKDAFTSFKARPSFANFN